MTRSELMRKFLKVHRQFGCGPVKIRCIGDALVDEYYKVKVNRISPEFPMPIMRSCDKSVVRRPGGVANVAYQLRHFNVEVALTCFTDRTLTEVLSLHRLAASTADVGGLSGRQGFVPLKKRYLHDNVQVCRRDVEADQYALEDRSLREAQGELFSKVGYADVTILSDYDKGTFRNVSDLSFLDTKLTIVDPKKPPLDRWRNCTVFKPNSKEAEDLSGYSDWRAQAHYFKEELNCHAVVITDGGKGVRGIWGEEHFEVLPERKVQVESVIGAGDCFVAILGLAMGLGFDSPEAVEIAYEAGSVYVQQNLNRPIIPAELMADGIVEPEDLWHRDFKLVFTNGCFDIMHPGHLNTLKFAKSKGDKLVVALNTDESIQRLKGPNRPRQDLESRMAVMAALEMVDFVTYFNEDTPLEVIKKIQPDAIVKGADYALDNIVGADIVSEVYRAPIIEGHSTTAILGNG